jgi:hypothetical protein
MRISHAVALAIMIGGLACGNASGQHTSIGAIVITNPCNPPDTNPTYIVDFGGIGPWAGPIQNAGDAAGYLGAAAAYSFSPAGHSQFAEIVGRRLPPSAGPERAKPGRWK